MARGFLETVRIDPATEIAGLRINLWMSGIGILLAGGWLLRYGRKPPDDAPDGDAAPDEGEVSDAAGADGGVEEIEMTLPDEGGA